MISVCISTYNGEKYIKEQVISILNQLNIDDEIIISDDNSSDNTINIINNIKDNRIKIFKNKINLGYTANFEKSIKYSSGDYIFLSDQDDIWHKDKVKIFLEYFNNYDLIVSDAKIINKNGDIIINSYFEIRKTKKDIISNIIKFGCLGCCLAFKKKILIKALPFPKNKILCTHDNWLFLIGCIYYKYIILDDKLVFYRRHNENYSTGGLLKSTTFYFKVYYRIYLLINILLRIF